MGTFNPQHAVTSRGTFSGIWNFVARPLKFKEKRKYTQIHTHTLKCCYRRQSKSILSVANHQHQWYRLQGRHYERDDVSNHRRLDGFLNRLFKRWSMKISKLRVTGLCGGNSPVTDECLSQRASNMENVSIWWRHHAKRITTRPSLQWWKTQVSFRLLRAMTHTFNNFCRYVGKCLTVNVLWYPDTCAYTIKLVNGTL